MTPNLSLEPLQTSLLTQVQCKPSSSGAHGPIVSKTYLNPLFVRTNTRIKQYRYETALTFSRRSIVKWVLSFSRRCETSFTMVNCKENHKNEIRSQAQSNRIEDLNISPMESVKSSWYIVIVQVPHSRSRPILTQDHVVSHGPCIRLTLYIKKLNNPCRLQQIFGVKQSKDRASSTYQKFIEIHFRNKVLLSYIRYQDQKIYKCESNLVF